MTETMSPESAYQHCEQITWSQARNFAYGIRLLPRTQRRAMSALYALARRIDDVGDGDWPDDRKLAALQELHQAIEALEAGQIFDSADPVLVALHHAASEFPIPVSALHEIVEGCELDVRAVAYTTMDDTVRYCRLVAGSVGRLSLGVFGTKTVKTATATKSATAATQTTALPQISQTPQELADDLGVGLQLTNMLRDIVEDCRMGRIYLPASERERFGITAGGWDPAENAAELVQFIAGQAVIWFERGLLLLDHLDYRSRACTATMAGIYRRLLSRILADPHAPLSGRVSLPASQKVLVAARSLSGLRP